MAQQIFLIFFDYKIILFTFFVLFFFRSLLDGIFVNIQIGAVHPRINTHNKIVK